MYQPAFNAKDLTVLVVDDFATMRRIIKNMLKDMGIDFVKIIEASDGVEALVKIKSMSFDLVLTDWNMPNMDGLSFLQQLRKNNDNVPVILITAEAKRENIIEAAKNGANGYIIKPFNFNVFCNKINKVVKENYNYLMY